MVLNVNVRQTENRGEKVNTQREFSTFGSTSLAYMYIYMYKSYTGISLNTERVAN